MPALDASYFQKVRRAKKHLIQLKRELKRFSDLHPYELVMTREGKKQRTVHTLVITRDPRNTDIPLIMCDIIYNLRSALEHLAASLVPRSKETSVQFPIFFAGVWELARPTDNAQIVKDRQRWTSVTRHMDSEAIAIIRSIQPDAARLQPTETHILASLNNLSNVDRHRRLPLMVGGFDNDARFTFHFGDPNDPHFSEMAGRGIYGVAVEQRTKIKNMPKGAMDVQFKGTAYVSIQVRTEAPALYLRIDKAAAQMIEETRRVIEALLPYLDH